MYYDLNITEYTDRDIPSLKALWVETFGDKPELVDRFFELLPSMGTGLVAECRGEILGAAYIIISELWMPEKAPKKLGYIYAVAVEPSARCNGIGAKLTRACRRWCCENGIDICCTLPAEDSLYGWYKQICGFEPICFCNYEKIYPSISDKTIKKLYADEYGFKRADLFKNNNYVNFYYGWLLYQQAICEAYGGGMYALDDGIACGYVEDGVLHIKEVLNESEDFIPLLCAKLGAEYALVRRPALFGQPFVAACGIDTLPGDIIWNLALD